MTGRLQDYLPLPLVILSSHVYLPPFQNNADDLKGQVTGEEGAEQRDHGADHLRHLPPPLPHRLCRQTGRQ